MSVGALCITKIIDRHNRFSLNTMLTKKELREVNLIGRAHIEFFLIYFVGSSNAVTFFYLTKAISNANI